MLLTSQNRVAVIQASSAQMGGQGLAAAVVHRLVSAKRPYVGMRRTRPFGSNSTFRDSKREAAGGHRHQPAIRRQGLAPRPRMWACLVLSKTARS